ncbi:hypothetical protein AB0L70_04520 [Kribbella sp. NPDC051952]|uniref:hypothetical protein n=1 Tax=Kribbella sp. NPDC051952 TaxID=3154851 RepID=UPI003423BD0B
MTISNWRRTAGWIGCAAGVVGVIAGLLTILWPDQVDTDTTGFTVLQSVLAVRDVGLAILLTTLWPAKRARAIWVAGAVAGMLVLAALEIITIFSRHDNGAAYGLTSYAIGLCLILGAIRPVRRLPLALGIYVFVPMTPAIMAGFVLEQLVIAGWMAGFALLGWRSVAPAQRADSLVQGERA